MISRRLEGPVDKHRPTNQVFLRYQSKKAAVKTVIAIVAHAKKMSG